MCIWLALPVWHNYAIYYTQLFGWYIGPFYGLCLLQMEWANWMISDDSFVVYRTISCIISCNYFGSPFNGYDIILWWHFMYMLESLEADTSSVSAHWIFYMFCNTCKTSWWRMSTCKIIRLPNFSNITVVFYEFALPKAYMVKYWWLLEVVIRCLFL